MAFTRDSTLDIWLGRRDWLAIRFPTAQQLLVMWIAT